jgi:3-phosphoshikimate 1-carboxyvinyltransferase
MLPMTVGSGGDVLTVVAGGPLRGTLRVPGDKSISHRALMLAALAGGTSEITGLSDGADVAATARAIESLGAVVEPVGGALVVGCGRLTEPAGPIDIGNSGTSIRLLAGIAAGCPFTTIIGGDASVNRRPMDRVAQPLRLMGAAIDGADGGRRAPLRITGGGLRGIRFEPPVASAQVKSAVLLAGLFADGETVVHELVPTRAHTEEMLAEFGADVRVHGAAISVRASRPDPFRYDVPGDPSAAAFWLVGAAIVPGSEITVDDVYQGRGRDGYLRVLEAMGADLSVEATGDGRARLSCRSGALGGVTVTAAEVPDLIDEIPVLAVAAAVAEGPTRFEGVAELRHKESDRLRSVLAGLAALGADAEVDGDTLVVAGGARPRGGVVDAVGDHRIAMAFCIGALAAPRGDGTVISGWRSVATSYPGFAEDLQRCRQP